MQPLIMIILQIIRKVIQLFRDYYTEIKDISTETRTSLPTTFISSPKNLLKDLDISGIDKEVADHLSEMYLDHRFDLLGSGWVRNSYTSVALGFEGNRYDMNLKIDNYDNTGKWISSVLQQPFLVRSSEIWKQVTPTYIPIDWQKDIKSGYRWDSKKSYKHQKIAPVMGADIKLPWEFSRMQHLPRMAILSQVSKEYTTKLILEFKNQILDFYSTNPPRMGVNWTCTMDVAIRATNLLVAYDLFVQIDDGSILDNEFRIIFAQCINDHGIHIYNNLEYNYGNTNNHYLANIVGLIFIAAYFPNILQSDEWLFVGIKELLKEFRKQFNGDGTNFEGSTSYHCLSTELILYAAAILIGISERTHSLLVNKKNKTKSSEMNDDVKYSSNEKYGNEIINIFPSWFYERLFKAGNYILCLTKPTKEIPQIGDGDSGHLLQLSPNGKFKERENVLQMYDNLHSYRHDYTRYWDENHLNFTPLLSAIEGLLKTDSFKFATIEYPLEQSIIMTLTKGKRWPTAFVPMVSAIKNELSNDSRHFKNKCSISNSIDVFPYRQLTVISNDIKKRNESFTHNIRLYKYPDSGIYIFSSSRVHLTLSIGACGLQKVGGHAHRDRLSFELNIDGNDLVVDPGTYVYTSSPKRRNEFRSLHAHNGILFVEKNIEKSNNINIQKIFSLNEKVFCLGVMFDENSIESSIQYQSCLHHRSIRILEDTIQIEDMSNIPFTVNINKFSYYSNGYGRLMNMASHRSNDQWQIQ
jgi:hypothetical protein